MEDNEITTRRYLALVVLGIAMPFLLTPFLSLIFLSHDQSFAYRLTCSRFLIWGVLGIMALYAKFAEVQKFFLWADEKYNLSFYILSVIVLYLLVFADGILAHIPYWLGLHEKNTAMHKMQQTMQQYPVLMVFTSVTAGITEEFIFRGYIISRLSLLFSNKILPVFISALLFASVHLGYHNTSELIFTFFFGLTFGYFYQKYRSLIPLVIVHILWDLYASMILMHHR